MNISSVVASAPVHRCSVGWTPRLDGGLTIEHELKVQDSIVLRMICGTRNRIIRRLRQNVAYKLEQVRSAVTIRD